MKINPKEFEQALAAIGTAYGTDISRAKPAVIINTAGIVMLYGIATNYKVYKTVSAEFENEDDINGFCFVISLKKLQECTALAKTSSGETGLITIEVLKDNSSINFNVKTFDNSTNDIIMNITQTLPYEVVDNKLGQRYDLHSVNWAKILGQQKDESTITLNKNDLLNVLSKFINDSTNQIIFNAKNNIIAANSSKFCTILKSELSILDTSFETAYLKGLYTVFKNININNIEVDKTGEKYLFRAEDGRTAMEIVATSKPNVSNIRTINQFCSFDYGLMGFSVGLSSLTKFITSYKNITGADRAEMKVQQTESGWQLLLSEPDSNNKFCSFILKVSDMADDISENNRTYLLNLDILLSCLKTLNGSIVKVNTCVNQVDDKTTIVLLKLSSKFSEEDTVGICCFTSLDNKEEKNDKAGT